MSNKLMGLMIVAAVAALLTPGEVDAYGARHYGYTHVGPSGVYHAGGTAAYGPRGVATTGHTSAYGYGGGAYHSGYGAAAGHYGNGGGYNYSYGHTGYGAAAGGYHYNYYR